MDAEEWDIVFEVYLVDGESETTVGGSAVRLAQTEVEAGELFLAQWKRTFRKNKEWFAALVNETTGIDQVRVPDLKKSGASPGITIIEIKPSDLK